MIHISKTAFILAASLSSTVLFSNCASTMNRNSEAGSNGFNKHAVGGYQNGAGEFTSVQNRLVDAAYWAIGRKDISCNNRSFVLDCSGVVSAIYWKAGIDLQAAYVLYTGNGVTRIYRYLEEKKLLYRPDRPAPGDIIFWDNTYDRNTNGLVDDELTHIGMVVTVSPEGDVTYIHHDYISGVIFARMFPSDPSNRNRNSAMRMQLRGLAPDGKVTSGDLYRNAGRGWELELAKEYQ